MVQEGSDDDAVVRCDAGLAAELDPLAACPADLLLVALVLYELVVADVHHHVAAVRQAEAY